MTDLNEAIYEYLASVSSLTARVGTRIRPDVLDDGETLPAVVFWRVSGIHTDTIDGTFGGLAEARVTIETYDTSRKGTNRIAEEVRLAMIDMRGTRSGVKIRNVSVDSGQEHYVNYPTDGNGTSRYVTAQDFRISFSEDG